MKLIIPILLLILGAWWALFAPYEGEPTNRWEAKANREDRLFIVIASALIAAFIWAVAGLFNP